MRGGVRPYLWMVGGALCFASMGAMSGLLGRESDFRVLCLVRSGVMAAIAVAIALATGAPFVRGSLTLWVRSIVGTIGMFCTFYTLTHLPFSEATTLIKCYPLLVALLSWGAFRERPTGKTWIAIGAGIVGLVLVAQPRFAEAHVAILVGLASSLCTSVVMLGLNRLGHVDSRSVVTHFALTSTVICAAVTAVSWPVDVGSFHTRKGLLMLLGLGIVGTGGQIALTRAFALGDASRVAVVGLTELVFAVGYDRLIWNRTYDAVTIAGIALVAAPTAWLLSVRRATPPPPAGEAGSA